MPWWSSRFVPPIDFSQFQSTPDTNFTDLAAGLRLAAAILPTDSLRRIVLLSDGQQNLGDALQEAQLLQQEGIRLDIVPLPGSNTAEARVDGLDAPTALQSNERFLCAHSSSAPSPNPLLFVSISTSRSSCNFKRNSSSATRNWTFASWLRPRLPYLPRHAGSPTRHYLSEQ